MTTDQLKNIFGRFQNLNLLFLIEDLRRGLVGRKHWHDEKSKSLCPLAHGWRGYRYGGKWLERTPFECLGVSMDSGMDFLSCWVGFGLTESKLLSTLESIYAERLADADVVQAVCLPIGEPVDVPQAQAVAQ